MVLHNHVNALGRRVFRQSSQAVGRQFDLFLISTAGARIDPDRMTAQGFRRGYPLVVVLDGFCSGLFVRVSQSTFPVNHDQQGCDLDVGAALFEFAKVLFVFGFVFEELVNEFDSMDAKFVLGNRREIQVVQFASLQGPVQRPLGQ